VSELHCSWSVRTQHDRIVPSVHISVLCTRKNGSCTLEDSHCPFLALSTPTFAHFCATLALDSIVSARSPFPGVCYYPSGFTFFSTTKLEPVNSPSHPRSRVFLLARHHHTFVTYRVLVRLLKFYDSHVESGPKRRSSLPSLAFDDSLCRTSTSFVNWSE
jgi:hypothetical protein